MTNFNNLFADKKLLTIPTQPRLMSINSDLQYHKQQRKMYWQKHNVIVKHIKSGKGVDIDLMNSVLFDDIMVTKDVLSICESIKPITVPLPYPGVETNFTQLAGSANAASARSVPGCYDIRQGTQSYIGQSTRLGKRVREHSELHLACLIGS